MPNTTIDSIGIEISASAESANAAIDKLQKQLDKISAAMENITNGAGYSNLNKLTQSLNALSSVKIPNELSDNLTNVAKAVSKFGNSSVSNAMLNLPNITKSLADMSRYLSGNPLNFDAKPYASLFNSISRLGGVNISTVLSNINQIPTALKKLSTGLNGIKFTGDFQGLTQFTSALGKLGGKTSINAITNIPKMTSALKNMMETLSKAPSVSRNIIDMTNAMANLSQQGGKISNVSSSFTQSFGGFHTSLKKSIPTFGSLASMFGKFYTTYFLLIRGFKQLWKSINSAMDYIETYNYFDAAMDQVSSQLKGDWKAAGYESAQAYFDAYKEEYKKQATELTRKMTGFNVQKDGSLESTGGISLGMNPDMLLNYQAMYAQMSSSMGVASDYAIKLSDAMTRLGADLASVKNLDFAETYDKIASGLTGAARSVDIFGTNIRDANLQQTLLNYGIDANIKKLTQNDKALLRSIVLLDSTRYAWADLSDTLNQPSNQLRMLSANFETLSRTIGNIFLGSVTKLLPYINALVISLQRLAQWIIDVFHIELPNITSQATGSLSDLMDDMEDGLDGATGSAKKLKQQLLGIDELNVISSDTSGGTGVGGSMANTEAIQKAFDTIYEEYIKTWEKAYADVENKSQQFANNLSKIARTTSSLINKGFSESYKANDAEIQKQSKKILNSLQKIFSDKKLQDSALGFAESFYTTIGSVIGSIASVGSSLNLGILKGFSDSLEKNSPFITEKLTSIYDNLTQLSDSVKDFSDAVSTVGKAFESDSFSELIEFFVDLKTVVDLTILDRVTGFYADLATGISKPLLDNADKLEQTLEKTFDVINEMLQPAKDLLSIITDNSENYMDSDFHGIMMEITEFDSKRFSAILDLFNDFLDFTKEIAKFDSEKFSVLIDFVKGFTQVDSEKVSIIKDLIIDSAQFAPEGFSKFIDFIVEISNFDSEKLSDINDFMKGIQSVVINLTDNYSISDLLSPIGFLRSEFDNWDIDVKKWIDENIINDFKEIAVGYFLSDDMKQAFDDIKETWNTAKEDFGTFIYDLELIFKETFSPLSDWYKENVSDKINKNTGGISEKFSEQYEKAKEKWLDFADWFDENVSTPVKDKINDIKESISEKFSEAWDNVKRTALNAANSIINSFESSINNIIKGFNNKIEDFNSNFSNIPGFKGLKEIPKINIPEIKGYANGGLVTSSEIFMARENGMPEYVGRFGNHTAVANNDQIVSGISIGVRQAVSEVLLPILNEILGATEECASKEGLTEDGILDASLNAARIRNRATNRPVFNY